MANLPGSIIFDCPADLMASYVADLGQEGNDRSPGTYSDLYQGFSTERGYVPVNRPIFDANGNIKFYIDGRNYSRIEEHSSDRTAKFKDTFSYLPSTSKSVYREASPVRIGFEITIIDKRFPLFLLMEDLLNFQRLELTKTGEFKLLTCHDAVRFETEDYKNKTFCTARTGAIEEVSVIDNNGTNRKGNRPCDKTSDLNYQNPSVFVIKGFKVKFMESKLRRLH
ncbi:MAG: hypothetical protein F6J93_34425 [Oscillatoria sp. SIO1A7]|nr:hypothetical protein [Oscillatoria sp. SIO1A7]